jgi:hypothetical protein
VTLGACAASSLGCGRSSLVDELTSSPGGSGASSGGAPGGSGSPDGSVGDGGANLDATVHVEDGSTSTSGDAPSPGSCNFATCPTGCCLPDGTCFVAGPSADGSFPTDIPCGSNGEACATCPSDYICIGGGCLHVTGANTVCGPDNCNGCCMLGAMPAPGVTGASNTCFLGSQDLYCGSGGGQCQGCAPSTNGGHCVSDPGGGGHCEGIGTCNATNCAGCCAGDLCAVGTQDVGCGTAGAACQDCASDAGICIRLGTPDGGVDRFCGYGCLTDTPPPECSTYCASASDCFGTGDILQHL